MTDPRDEALRLVERLRIKYGRPETEADWRWLIADRQEAADMLERFCRQSAPQQEPVSLVRGNHAPGCRLEPGHIGPCQITVQTYQCAQPDVVLLCGHPIACNVISAETGEVLYCGWCNDISFNRDLTEDQRTVVRALKGIRCLQGYGDRSAVEDDERKAQRGAGCAAEPNRSDTLSRQLRCLERQCAEKIDELRARLEAHRKAYHYLQDRLESIGYAGWAHDMDHEIEVLYQPKGE